MLDRIDRRTVLALLATLGFLGVTYMLMFHDIPQGSRDILNIMLGALVILVKDAYGYDFNTSASSAAKDETIKAAAMASIAPAPDTPKGS